MANKAVPIVQLYIGLEVQIIFSAYNGSFQSVVFDSTQKPSRRFAHKLGKDFLTVMIHNTEELKVKGSCDPIVVTEFKPGAKPVTLCVVELYKDAEGIYGMILKDSDSTYDKKFLCSGSIGNGSGKPMSQEWRSMIALETFLGDLKTGYTALNQSKYDFEAGDKIQNKPPTDDTSNSSNADTRSSGGYNFR